MDSLQVIARQLALLLAGYLVKRGFASADQTGQIENFACSFIIAVVTFIWSKWHLNQKLNTVPPALAGTLTPNQQARLPDSGVLSSTTVPSLIVFLGLSLLVFGTYGCKTQTLDTAGVYGAQTNGIVLYQIDSVLTDAKDTFDVFLKQEDSLHSYLKTNAPAVVSTANTIRRNAPKWFSTAEALRGVYISNPTASNLLSLQTATAVIAVGLTQVTNYAPSLVITNK